MVKDQQFRSKNLDLLKRIIHLIIVAMEAVGKNW